MSVWDKIDFSEFTGEDQPLDPKLKKLLSKSHKELVRDAHNKIIGKLSGHLGGKITGKMNVENGTLKRASDIFVKKAKENPEKYVHIYSKGGKVQGNRNRESGHIYSISHLGGKASVEKRSQNMEKYLSDLSKAGKKGGAATAKSPKFALGNIKTCEHCGTSTNLGNYKRWHGDNCKKKSVTHGK